MWAEEREFGGLQSSFAPRFWGLYEGCWVLGGGVLRAGGFPGDLGVSTGRTSSVYSYLQAQHIWIYFYKG